MIFSDNSIKYKYTLYCIYQEIQSLRRKFLQLKFTDLARFSSERSRERILAKRREKVNLKINLIRWLFMGEKMKKIISVAFAISFALSLFAADIFEYVPLTGNAKNFTKTEYSIASKFGNYFRTPKVKYLHVFDEVGNEIESSELSPRDVVQNVISSVYDGDGNLTEQKFSNADGELIWKSTISYKNGLKSDFSEFDKDDNLKEKIIYEYDKDLLSAETIYDGDGALIWKTIYSYNPNGKIEYVYDYNGDGTLNSQKKYSYNETGAVDSIEKYEAFSSVATQDVFRYGSNNVLNEITTYNSEKRVVKRVILKYDEKGNVNKVSEYDVAQKFGTTVNELTAMSDYAYEY